MFAHFRSKEELQLATIDTACRIYNEVVVEPALTETSGILRLRGLIERFLQHVEDSVFPGGCFFASVAAEVDTHPGPVRDRAFAFVADWLATLRQAVADAQADGAIDPLEDADQLTFELDAYLLLANAQFVASGAPEALERARIAVGRSLESAAPPVAQGGFAVGG